MMNGALMICKGIEVDFNTGLMNLKGLFAVTQPFEAFLFDIYAHWAPEQLGRHSCDFRMYDRKKDTSKFLKYQDADIEAKHIEQHYYGLYVTKVFMPGLTPGFYSIDFYINDILTASHPLKIEEGMQ